jgi:hypothetical protein
MASSQPNFDVLFILLGIRWIYFGVFCASEGIEEIIGKSFSLIKSYFHITVKLFREGVTVIYSKNSLKEVDIDRDVEVFPGVMISEFANNLWNFLSFNENSLGNS